MLTFIPMYSNQHTGIGSKPFFIEACCPSLASVRRAVQAGARRIELCQDLAVGGITPSEALIRNALEVAGNVPINVLIRPREGDFVYAEEEIQAMEASIRLCKELGVNGVVVGALTPDGQLDQPALQRLLQAARPLHVTFHRAFDACSDPSATLEELIGLGVERLLTSGHCPDAYTGRYALKALVEQAAGRIVIMPGCGITPSNLESIAAVTGASEFHGSRLP